MEDRIRPHPHLMRTGNDPLRIIRELATLGETSVNCDLWNRLHSRSLSRKTAICPGTWRLHEPVDKSQIDEIFRMGGGRLRISRSCRSCLKDTTLQPLWRRRIKEQAESVAQNKPHLAEVPP